jgi:anti-sigma B factor antagonist
LTVTVSVSTGWQDGVGMVRLGGELDLAAGELVSRELKRAITAPGTRAVRVDLSGLRFIDSSGMSVLIKGRRTADETGVAYQVTGATGMVRHVLSLTGLLEHLCAGPPADSPR